MIQIVEYSDIPSYNGSEKSPVRIFAERTVEEFIRAVNGSGVAEVTDWPPIEGLDEIREATKVRDELDRAIYNRLYSASSGAYVNSGDRKVRAFRRKERVFIERLGDPE